MRFFAVFRSSWPEANTFAPNNLPLGVWLRRLMVLLFSEVTLRNGLRVVGRPTGRQIHAL